MIWVNNSPAPQKIIFSDNEVMFTCGTSTDFCVNDDGVFESDVIPLGGIACLCFMEKGMYECVIRPTITYSPEEEMKERHAIVWVK